MGMPKEAAQTHRLEFSKFLGELMRWKDISAASASVQMFVLALPVPNSVVKVPASRQISKDW